MTACTPLVEPIVPCASEASTTQRRRARRPRPVLGPRSLRATHRSPKTLTTYMGRPTRSSPSSLLGGCLPARPTFGANTSRRSSRTSSRGAGRRRRRTDTGPCSLLHPRRRGGRDHRVAHGPHQAIPGPGRPRARPGRRRAAPPARRLRGGNLRGAAGHGHRWPELANLRIEDLDLDQDVGCATPSLRRLERGRRFRQVCRRGGGPPGSTPATTLPCAEC